MNSFEMLQAFYDVTSWLMSEAPSARTDLGASQEYHDAMGALINIRCEARNSELVQHDESWWHRSKKQTLSVDGGHPTASETETPAKQKDHDR